MAVCLRQLRDDIPPPPRFMQQLPIDKRGYPVPWFVDWINGEPEFRAMDRRKFAAAINKRLCWTCGNPLYGEEVFVIGPMCAVNRISSEPPSHRECAGYAARACPFLSKPQMVRRKDGMPVERNAAGIMVERNPGVTLLWFTRRHRNLQVPNGVLFELGRPFHVEWYCKGRQATRAEVEDAITSGVPILRETCEKHDGPEGMKQLEQQIIDAMKLLPRI
jgi:hypothetical protein